MVSDFSNNEKKVIIPRSCSERVNKTNARNERLEEAKKINSSLLI